MVSGGQGGLCFDHVEGRGAVERNGGAEVVDYYVSFWDARCMSNDEKKHWMYLLLFAAESVCFHLCDALNSVHS